MIEVLHVLFLGYLIASGALQCMELEYICTHVCDMCHMYIQYILENHEFTVTPPIPIHPHRAFPYLPTSVCLSLLPVKNLASNKINIYSFAPPSYTFN